ncbi:hypothetical protein BOX15_Mlig024677g1 [Macrostomum lignano]|uniref:Uncharacterized protein n=1 Tax=Macrostomum lignano TaxID=282301 RepID=A0A267FM33_9PLAT|nr:hypothetical protein BOX15_Mlig024677g1 [Macrostomum lignano]
MAEAAQPPQEDRVIQKQPQQVQQQQPMPGAGSDPYRAGYEQSAGSAGYQMTVVSQQLYVGQSADGLRNWSSSICGCFDDFESCCLVYWCCPCYMCCCLSHRFGESCCAPFCLSLSGQSSSLVYRTKLRAAHGIRGGAIEDCCVTTGCCMACSVCQMKRELDFIEQTTGKPAFAPHR